MRVVRMMVVLALFGLLGVGAAVVAPAFACTAIATLRVAPDRAPPGATVRVSVAAFYSASDIQVSWLGDDDALTPLGTVAGPGGSLEVTIPSSARPTSLGRILGVQRDGYGQVRGLASGTVYVTAPRTGYRTVGSDGGVFAWGGAGYFGSTGGLVLNRPVVGIATTPPGDGYWLVASDGGVFAYGGARFFGSTGGLVLNRPIVGLAATPTGLGYWLVAADGGIFAFGDAAFFGSTGASRLAKPIVGMSASPSSRGYRLVAADGGIFTFGDASFHGSTGAVALARPVVGMAGFADGYWLAAADGAVFAFGSAPFGSSPSYPLKAGVSGIAPTPSGRGYWLALADGGVEPAGDAVYGTAAGPPLARPIVGITA